MALLGAAGCAGADLKFFGFDAWTGADGPGVGVSVGVGVGVSVGVFVGVGVGVAVGVFVGVSVGVAVGVSVGVLVGVGVGVSVGVFVGVFVGVDVGVFVGVLVGVTVGVLVGVFVAVFVGATGVWVGELVAVAHGIGVDFAATAAGLGLAGLTVVLPANADTTTAAPTALASTTATTASRSEDRPTDGCSPKRWTASRRFRPAGEKGRRISHWILSESRRPETRAASPNGDPCVTLLYDRRVHVCSGAVRA